MDDEEEQNDKIDENSERNKAMLMEDKKYFQVNEVSDSQKVKEDIKENIDETDMFEPKRSDTLKGTEISDNMYKKQRFPGFQKKRKNFTNVSFEQKDRFSKASMDDNF